MKKSKLSIFGAIFTASISLAGMQVDVNANVRTSQGASISGYMATQTEGGAQAGWGAAAAMLTAATGVAGSIAIGTAASGALIIASPGAAIATGIFAL
ncbi:hypothetical protein [Dyadobacter sp. 32]|uniref:hypothetical protein n=1 Tax=Dyadobacter sp. 32 TaxID=538966 RepID=UPI0011EEAAB6